MTTFGSVGLLERARPPTEKRSSTTSNSRQNIEGAFPLSSPLLKQKIWLMNHDAECSEPTLIQSYFSSPGSLPTIN